MIPTEPTPGQEGSRVLTFRDGFAESMAVAWFNRSSWSNCWGPVHGTSWIEPTHWMPLHAAPEVPR